MEAGPALVLSSICGCLAAFQTLLARAVNVLAPAVVLLAVAAVFSTCRHSAPPGATPVSPALAFARGRAFW